MRGYYLITEHAKFCTFIIPILDPFRGNIFYDPFNVGPIIFFTFQF